MLHYLQAGRGLLLCITVASGFVPLSRNHNTIIIIGHQPLKKCMDQIAEKSLSALHYNRDNSDNEGFDLEILEERIGNIRLQILEEDLQRPPKANISPKGFVEAVLKGIFYNEDPHPDAGFMLLLRCSTDKWVTSVLRSIGAPDDADLDAVASALGSAIARPNNQFAILTGDNQDDDDDDGDDNKNNLKVDLSEERNFSVQFPGETLDFLDGTAWINVEFRDKIDNSLLVLTGWQLAQRPDGAWLIDQIDWQDYRDEFRPGIGRDEWQGSYEGRRR